eukprot:TRINITY_DN64111_c0_g1_i1.p1 TRINITY_DN64111_c0_g1~~TRINITY_DN64111_c0_g1_i1.p1  ORF type:complete len:602 (-),score=129.56 TRINITY_DN64111_c0_g1_i1:59-1864(-)
MIQYDNTDWLGLVFRYHGTVLQLIWQPTLLIFVSCFSVWFFEVHCEFELGSAGSTIFGPTMCYLLVFRANNASQRYWMGRQYLTRIFIAVREFVMLGCVTCRGGAAAQAWRDRRAPEDERRGLEDANDIRTSMARVNFARWALAFVLSLKLHTRICYDGFINGKIDGATKRMIDWDRLRIRGLTTRQEFEDLNDLVPIIAETHVTRGAAYLTTDMIEEILSAPIEDYEVDKTPDMRQPLAIIVKLRQEIMKHMNEPWGFRERFSKDFLINFNEAGLLYEHVNTIICTPIPFPYVHLCKILLLGFLISTPLTIASEQGFFAGVILPTLVALSLLGIDSIAMELENPFGDGYNDLDIDSQLVAFEDEVMHLLDLAGDFRAKEAFRWLELPDALRESPHAGGSASETEFLLGDFPDEAGKYLSLRTQIRTEDDSPAGSADELPALEASALTLSGKRLKGGVRATFDLPEGLEDNKQPLLPPGGGGSEVNFKPMKEFGTETLVFEEKNAAKGGGEEALDFVGLNLDDPEEPGIEGEPGIEEGMEEEEGNDEPISPLSAGKSSLSQSARGSALGFVPIGEMASGTMVLEEEEGADGEPVQDVVGLD